MDAVCTDHFAMIIPVDQILVVFFDAAFTAFSFSRFFVDAAVIRLLYATSCRCIVAGNGQSDHRTVRKVDRALNQSFTERTASYHHSSVPILNGTCHNLTCRSRIFVYQYHQTSVTEVSVAFGKKLTALCRTSFCVDNQFFLSQELVCQIDGGIQITTSVALQVQNQVFHPFFLQLFQGF